MHNINSSNDNKNIVSTFINQINLTSKIGLWDWELKSPQQIFVSLEFKSYYPCNEADENSEERIVFLPKGKENEDGSKTIICYDAISNHIKDFVENSPHILFIETIACAILELLLKDKRILWAKVTVEKPNAIKGAKTTGIIIERDNS